MQCIEAVVEWQQRVPPESDDDRLLFKAENGRMRFLRARLAILDRGPLAPFEHRFGIDPMGSTQFRGRSSDRVRGRGAAMAYLSHSASFYSRENNALSNAGTKHLEHR